jgi:predicted KAP-like P-loop ATPase
MKTIITQIETKFKVFRELAGSFFFAVIFVVFVLIAFFLGRTYKFMENRPAFYFESLETEEQYREQILSEEKEKLFSRFREESIVQNKMIVASKGGKKYYFVWCSGAGNIKEANKRYFADELAAQKAGYTKAASCK